MELPSEDSGTDRDALESFVEDARPAAMQEMERFGDMYSDFSIEAEGSRTLVYEYTYRDQVDTAQARSQLETFYGTLRSTADVILAEMEDAGVNDPVVKWIYNNADGTTIGTVEFPE